MKLQDGLGANIGAEPDGFMAFQQKYCGCEMCKSVIKDCVPMQLIQECSQCNERFAYLLKTTSTMYPQLCQQCYIHVVGLEKAQEIKDIYIWMHPAEHELWGVTADDIGVLVEDTKTGHRLFIPMPEANKDLVDKYNFVLRGGGRSRLAQAKILCDPRLIPDSNCMENNINWDGSSLVENDGDDIHDGTTIKAHGNRKARRAAARKWAEHVATCPDCAEAEKADKPTLRERLFGRKKKNGCGLALANADAGDDCFDENYAHKGAYKQVEAKATKVLTQKKRTAEMIGAELGYSTEEAESRLQEMKKDGLVELTEMGWKLTPEHLETLRRERDNNAD